ncbi:lipase secretion chaperone [Variovorax sp. CY25R-8]|uniref:lipase secretion chaperone n=1 Tax=Variovorax sp. CY25R-8 TaxID=2855501 RepID=UPI0021BBA1A9|nr:lipase secretion chaperone [Variovorax sp. CY25R-8]
MTRRWPLVLAAAAVVALGGWWFGMSGPADSEARTGEAASAGLAPLPRAPAVTAPAAIADSFLTPNLRDRIEALLLEAGEAASPEDLKRRVEALVPAHFAPHEAARARALLGRYVDYRVALGALQLPADLGDPRALRDTVEARRRVREQHFMPDEYQALFGADDDFDRYSLARLEIERNTGLTPAQRQAALEDNERSLGETQRAQRAQTVAQLQVASQTAALEARGASDQERFAERSAQYGAPAAQQLAQLDREERDWQGRLAQYAALQSAKADAQSLEQMKQQLFTPEERMRLEAALQLRAQAAAAAPSMTPR